MVSHWKGDCHWGLRGTGSGLRCWRGEMSAPFVFSCNATNPPLKPLRLHASVFLQQICVPKADEWTRFVRTLAEINENRDEAEELANA